MSSVFYEGEKYEVDEYDRLMLTGLEIQDLSEIEGLENLQNVKSLSLQNNKITQIKGLENFTRLETLYIYYNEIEKIENLEQLKSLKKLILSDNRILKIEGLDKLENLIELNLSNNQIEKIEGLSALSKLEYLDLHGNKISEIEGINSLTNLRTLYLNNNSIKEIRDIDNLISLQKLYLDNNQISEIKGLESFDKLVYIRIDSNPFPENLLEELDFRDGAAYKPINIVEYCKKKKEQELLEIEKATAEPSEEVKKVKFIEFEEKFQDLENNWKFFIEENTYLIYDKKAEFINELNGIIKFPWYYRIRYPSKLKKIKNKTRIFEQKIHDYNKLFIEQRLKEHHSFFEGKEYGIKSPLDLDQRIAVIKDDKHNLIIAGAGSGKTSVITNRIAYLLNRKDKIQSEKILALAFTNVAAQEMRERLKNTYHIDIDISTFHALGRRIIQQETNHRPNLITNEYEVIKDLFNQLLEKEEFQNLFLKYLLYHSEDEIEEENFEDKELYYKYMRNKSYSTLNNIQVKSISERDIGNFLFRHDIPFLYEPLVEWVDADEDGEKQYHPDFFLPKYDIYIEHWGLNKKFKVPDWFTISSEEYCANRDWKLAQFEKHQKTLVETWEYERIEGNLILKLITKLKEIEPEIEFRPLPFKELVEKTSEFDLKKNDILTLVSSFIQIAKSNFLMEDDIAQRLNSKKYSRKQKAFGEVALQVYKDYQKYLRKEKKIDFNDMINLAVELIKRNPDIYLNMYDHILIDEFQDISHQRMELINCFVNDKSNTKLFCVGDDWQSIYQFTGSDVRFFVNFDQYFSTPEMSFLKRNYRSSQIIVGLSNYVISHNKNQIHKEIYSKTDIDSKLIIHFEIGSRLADSDKISPPFIFNLIKNLLDNGAKAEEIMVISRFNLNLRKIEIFCGANDIPIEEKGPRGLTKGVRFYSAHKSKGSESKYVILTDLTSGVYGFPCEIQDSSIFEIAKRFVSKSFIEEERRLFYVALTRSKQFLFLFSVQDKPSIFLTEIISKIRTISIPSEVVWEKVSNEYIPNLLQGFSQKTDIPFFCKNCGGVLLERQGKNGEFLGCSNYPICKFTFTVAGEDEEKCPKCGRKMVERQGKHGKFLGCTGYPTCKYTIDLEVDDKSIKCPECNSRLISKTGKYGKFISCIGYPNCRFSFNPSSNKRSRIKCPLCGSLLAPRKGKYGLFLGCSNYPKCKYTFNI